MLFSGYGINNKKTKNVSLVYVSISRCIFRDPDDSCIDVKNAHSNSYAVMCNLRVGKMMICIRQPLGENIAILGWPNIPRQAVRRGWIVGSDCRSQFRSSWIIQIIITKP